MQLVKIKLKHLALLILVILISFSGCSTKNEIVRVKAACKTPDVQCDFRGSSIDEILGKYLECIIDLKKANKVCK